MERTLHEAEVEETVQSRDHRVIQAIAMRNGVKNKKTTVRYPDAVNKSWPQFWRFLKGAEALAQTSR
jgi:5-enolpyruvylshikimate-3-phosphate synthase